ncbi:putative ribonuclease H-like domain-containing protein [Tanacetum coccineum]
MDQDSVHMVAASKVPMLKPGEYELWRMRMEQYIQMVDYSLWEVIENGNAPPITKLVEGVETIIAPSTAEEKAQRSSTNGAVNTAYGVTTASTQATAVNSTIIDNLSDAVICAFFANGYANNEGKEILEEHWKKAYCEWAPRNQENRNKENTRRVVPVETTTSNALISCDGLGDYDWSDQAEEGPTNFALMAYSSTSSNSEVSTDSNCLESVEARLLVYKKNESVYEEDIKLLKREIYLKEVAITKLRRKLELAQKQKDEIQLTIEKLENSSKSLSKLIDCLIVDKCKTEEFVNEPIVSEPTVKKPVVEAKASADKPKAVKKNNGALIIKDWVSDSEEEDMPQAKIQKKTVKPSFAKIEFVKSKEQVKTPRKTTVKQGSNFEMINKACYVCGSFDHLQYNCDNHQRQFNNKKMVKPVWNYTQRVNHHNFSRMTHSSPKRNMVPKVVLMRSGLVLLTTARPVNTAQPKTTMNSARPMTNRVNTVSVKNVNTARPKVVVNTAKPKAVVNAVQGNQVNAVKGNQGNPQMDLQDQGVIDNGCSRHMTGNMSYLTDFVEIDGGYVAFGELEFNLFNVSQMCDKKNSVLFNDTECIVLSPNFKLTDESHVLLKVPRKNNMYSVDLKNIIPKGGLTYLFAKATSNESKLWHKRLGHINFKTMNKLVKGNLVRGLPSKLFENDQTCVACQKGKQHRASCKSKTVSSISQPLHMLHMDLFGPTFVKSLMKKMYCLVVTDDYNRFSWVFFLATKDETSGILKSFITRVENLIDQRVKVIRCDNGTEFKNKEMNQFCERKCIKREFSVARTPQQNGVV